MMKICYFGDYDPEYSRNRIFLKALCGRGSEIVECRSASKGMGRYVCLVRKLYVLREKYDIILVGYSLSRVVVLLAKIFGNKPVVWNPLFSLYDSWILDRKLAKKKSLKAKYYFWLDKIACGIADGIILDTEENITFFSETFNVPHAKFKRIFVGTDEEVFHPCNREQNNVFTVHFHGNFIPFHGVEYIIRAAKILENENIAFNIIGSGQTYARDRALAESLRLKNIRFVPKIPYQELAEQIAASDLCLGVFGDAERVNRVIPNKIFEAAAMGKPILTGESKAVAELFKNAESILFCKSKDPLDIAKKIMLLQKDDNLRRKIANNGYLKYLETSSFFHTGTLLQSYLSGFVRMKILFLVPHLKISGGIRVLLTYADLLAGKGHDVSVAVLHKQKYRRMLANVLNSKPSWFSNLRASILRIESFKEKFLPSADIVIAGNHEIALLMENFPKRVGSQFYFVQHDEGLYHGNRVAVDRAFNFPSKKLVVSNWLKEIIQERCGQTSELLLNPVDPVLFHPTLKEAHDEVRILILDHTYEWKGTKEGVEIVNELKKKYPSIRLLGFGARRKKSPYHFDEYYFNPPQKKLAWLYSRSDIFLCPSWDEGFGLPSIEAMHCKTAVVTYDNGGSRDFAFEGKTAMVAERRNMAELKEKLEKLVTDNVLREKIAEGGYKFVQTLPTWEEQVEKLESSFSGCNPSHPHQIVSQRSPPFP